ncbi:MAG: hypothetical protein HKN00_06560 [Flavobacteriaceae bacterium]|nr:hypothetical protein [Bacteroidia bacterium]MBT8288541.1 hypothetical protein [Bacteroidia bacterium]NNF74827.1 hypothetical protein [Flavobacteriaceae bacterium]NNK72314.1 hypothetical protein [Flavobacteriaceae bacterium]
MMIQFFFLSLIDEENKKTEYALFTEITDLIEVIIWPLAVITIVLFFRKHLAEIIGKVGSIKASASGFSMSFQESIDKLIVDNSQSLPTISKSSNGIGKKSPLEQLKALNINLRTDLKFLAKENGVDTSDLSVEEIGNALCDKGVMTRQKLKAFLGLYQLTQSDDPNISQAQVDHVKLILNDLDI